MNNNNSTTRTLSVQTKASPAVTATQPVWRPALGLSMLMLIGCGLLYSPMVTTVGGWLFPLQAHGSLISATPEVTNSATATATANGRYVGSALIGQPFSANHYFHGRPSSVGTDPMATGGSNLAPSNPALRQRVSDDSQHLAALYQVTPQQLPVDLLASSGSGVDPHISPAAARLQLARVAAARGISQTELELLLSQQQQGPQWGVLGQPTVNVLQLNLALDQQFPLPATVSSSTAALVK
jgi:K+-transporting ATPase ATPase C chain